MSVRREDDRGKFFGLKRVVKWTDREEAWQERGVSWKLKNLTLDGAVGDGSR